VCVRERRRERERESAFQRECVCVREGKRESVCVCPKSVTTICGDTLQFKNYYLAEM